MFEITIEPGLSLELLHIRHAPALHNLSQSNRDYLKEWLPWLIDGYSIEDTRQFITMTMKQYADNLGFQSSIIYKGELAGVTGYHAINHTNHSGSIGYWLGQAYSGTGIMTKSVKKVIEIGFNDYELEKVEIRCATGNIKSAAIPERLGFKKDGIIRQNEWLYDHYVDHVIYTMLRSEFRSG